MRQVEVEPALHICKHIIDPVSAADCKGGERPGRIHPLQRDHGPEYVLAAAVFERTAVVRIGTVPDRLRSISAGQGIDAPTGDGDAAAAALLTAADTRTAGAAHAPAGRGHIAAGDGDGAAAAAVAPAADTGAHAAAGSGGNSAPGDGNYPAAAATITKAAADARGAVVVVCFNSTRGDGDPAALLVFPPTDTRAVVPASGCKSTAAADGQHRSCRAAQTGMFPAAFQGILPHQIQEDR